MTLSFGFLSYFLIYIFSFLCIQCKKNYNVSPIALFLNNTITVIERELRNLSYVLTFARLNPELHFHHIRLTAFSLCVV